MREPKRYDVYVWDLTKEGETGQEKIKGFKDYQEASKYCNNKNRANDPQKTKKSYFIRYVY